MRGVIGADGAARGAWRGRMERYGGGAWYGEIYHYRKVIGRAFCLGAICCSKSIKRKLVVDVVTVYF